MFEEVKSQHRTSSDLSVIRFVFKAPESSERNIPGFGQARNYKFSKTQGFSYWL